MTINATTMDQGTTSERFAFGRNWQDYLRVLTEERIAASVASLSSMLDPGTVAGASFLDVGSGSGLSSLAAYRLGAARIHSFDYDADSVASTQAVRERFAPDARSWTVERGNALDAAYIESLGKWDIVYSWGVLHHTGDMWRGLDAVTRAVRPDGLLYVAIYNDQGAISRGWTRVKRLYNAGVVGRGLVLAAFVPYFVARGLASDVIGLRNPLARYHEYQRTRGMSVVHDWRDWLGGYPFEVATPEAIFEFYRVRGFALERLKTCRGTMGCNEFVFRRVSS